MQFLRGKGHRREQRVRRERETSSGARENGGGGRGESKSGEVRSDAKLSGAKAKTAE